MRAVPSAAAAALGGDMGVALSTVIDRLYRDYLSPPDEQPAQTTLDGNVDEDDDILTLTDGVFALEEEESIGAGTILEAGQELVMVTAVAWPTVTVRRAVLGTSPAAHLDGTPVLLRPKYSRRSVFDAVCDAVEELNGDLYAVATSATFTTVDSLVEVPATVERILGVYYRNTDYDDTAITRYITGGNELLVDLPTSVSSTGRALQLHGVPTGRTCYYVYRTGFTRPVDETYDLTVDAPNFHDEWIPLLHLGALVNIIAGTDITTRTQEFITEAVETQGYPVGSAENISTALIRVYEYRLGKAVKAQNRLYPMRVEHNQVAWA